MPGRVHKRSKCSHIVHPARNLQQFTSCFARSRGEAACFVPACRMRCARNTSGPTWRFAPYCVADPNSASRSRSSSRQPGNTPGQLFHHHSCKWSKDPPVSDWHHPVPVVFRTGCEDRMTSDTCIQPLWSRRKKQLIREQTSCTVILSKGKA